MSQPTMLVPNVTIGLDLGDTISQTCELDAARATVRKARVATTEAGLRRYFGGRDRGRAVLEVGHAFSLGQPPARGSGPRGHRREFERDLRRAPAEEEE